MNRIRTTCSFTGGLIVAVVALAALFTGCSKGEAPEAPRPTPVHVAHASQGPAVPPIDTNGIVVNKDEMRLSFKMGGVVRRIHVQEGDAVKRGQRLAEIELTEVDAQVEQARQMAEKATRDLERGENLYADRSSASNSCRTCVPRRQWPRQRSSPRSSTWATR